MSGLSDILEKSSLDLSHHAKRAAVSTETLPSAPRIFIPYGSGEDKGLPKALIQRDMRTRQELRDDELSTILPWEYEHRRTAQAILPKLFLGPLAAAKDRAFLREHGITMVIGIQQHSPGTNPPSLILAGAARAASELDIGFEAIYITADQELTSRLGELVAGMRSHLEANEHNKLLIFDETGNCRAPVVVAAFLMDAYPTLDHVKAMQAVHCCRRSVAFSEAYKLLMQAYDDVMRAKNDVAAAAIGDTETHAAGDTQNLGLRCKRGRSDFDADNDDSDDDCDDDENGPTESIDQFMKRVTTATDDFERFGNRQYAMPFIDEA